MSKKSFKEFLFLLFKVDILSSAAAFAFYCVLSLSPILILCFSLLNRLDEKHFLKLQEILIEALGPNAILAVHSAQQYLQHSEHSFRFSIIGLMALIFSASGVVSEIQNSLNLIFTPSREPHEIDLEEKKSDFKHFLKLKAYSVSVLFIWIFLVSLSLVLSLSFGILEYFYSGSYSKIAQWFGSYFIYASIFLVMYKYLPTRHPGLKFSLYASLLCTLLFQLGRWLMHYYFSLAQFQNYYGAFSAAIIFLLWAYYNGIIVVATACFAKVYFRKWIRVSK